MSVDDPHGAERPPAHLLAIDDDPANLALVRSVLAAYRVTTAEGPADALQLLDDGLRPDLIVCDVTMPGMTGFQLHEALRQRPALRSVPFVYLTALDAPADRRRGMGLGADDYLVKPFAPGDLRRAVAARLERVNEIRSSFDATWSVTTLGGLDVRLGETRIAWESRRAAEAFLLLLAEEEVTLHELSVGIWSQPPQGNQAHALVSRLRKALAPHAQVRAEGERLRLVGVEPLVWDVATFERAADEAAGRDDPVALLAALDAYAGPFLPDAESPWAERLRVRLEDRADALHQALIAASDGAAREAAERRYRRFLEMDDDEDL